MLHRSFGIYIATGDTANINNISMKGAEIPIRPMGLTQLPV